MAIESTGNVQFKTFPNYAEMEDADIKELNNPQYVPQYAKEIYNYLRTVEVFFSDSFINYGRKSIFPNQVTLKSKMISTRK